MKYMQWIALSAAAAGVAACCIGCARPGGKEASASQKLGGSFTAEMIMEMEDLTASGTISRIGEGQWSVAFAEPASLAGVVLDFPGILYRLLIRAWAFLFRSLPCRQNPFWFR